MKGQSFVPSIEALFHVFLSEVRRLGRLASYNLVKRKASVPPVVLATCKVGRPIYSYFEKGCRKKCKRQSRKVLWVVLSSLFFKESNKSRFDSYIVRKCIDRIPYYLSGLSRALFPTTFLEIFAYMLYLHISQWCPPVPLR